MINEFNRRREMATKKNFDLTTNELNRNITLRFAFIFNDRLNQMEKQDFQPNVIIKCLQATIYLIFLTKFLIHTTLKTRKKE